MSADAEIEANEPQAAEAAADDAREDDAAAGGRPPRRWGRWVALVAGLVLVGAYLALAVSAAGRIPAGTQVLGVDVGGMGRAQAIAALEPAAAAAESVPVEITVEDRAASIDPTDSGLAVDSEATVDGLMGFSLGPFAIMRSFSGAPVDVRPVTVVDADALVDQVEVAGASLAAGAQDAVVTISDTGAAVEPGTDGVGVDADGTADVIADAWPVASVAAVTAPQEPAITTAAAEAFAADLNARVLVADVFMTGPNGDATVTSDQLVRWGSTAAVDGELVLVIDGDSLARELEEAQPGLVSSATPASFRFTSSHDLQTVESQPGLALDRAALGPAVVAGATSPDRTGELPYAETEPAITSDDLGVSDFKEKVASFSTPLTPEPIRTKNLVRGAEMVSGTVVKPDETFSLIEALSPITADNGYFPAHVIVDGYLSDGIGGGLSQMATTLYNATYFTGLEDVEHRPHSKYFSRYPAGRESTIYIGSIDVKFKNNTPYALVLSSYVSDGSLHVDVWSTPYFTVKTSASDRSNVKKATMVESDHEGCLDTPIGADGFTITNTREVYLGDELVDKKSYTWTYRPNDGVTCV